MRIVGILLALAGWLIPILALSMTQSTGARFAACLLGIAVSLVGILGVLNKAHLQNAIWKKG
jgi:hypothetical protein